jgi:hypothetical protein
MATCFFSSFQDANLNPFKFDATRQDATETETGDVYGLFMTPIDGADSVCN